MVIKPDDDKDMPHVSGDQFYANRDFLLMAHNAYPAMLAVLEAAENMASSPVPYLDEIPSFQVLAAAVRAWKEGQ